MNLFAVDRAIQLWCSGRNGARQTLVAPSEPMLVLKLKLRDDWMLVRAMSNDAKIGWFWCLRSELARQAT